MYAEWLMEIFLNQMPDMLILMMPVFCCMVSVLVELCMVVFLEEVMHLQSMRIPRFLLIILLLLNQKHQRRFVMSLVVVTWPP